MPLEFPCTTEEMVTGITLNPVTATGAPSAVETGSVTATVQSGDGTTGTADGTNVPDLMTGTTPGDVVFLVSADADLGSGVVTISDLVTLHVTSPMATSLGISGGTVVPKTSGATPRSRNR
jgi:hypothetical protein